jgi:hypothetical protein
MIYGFCNFSYNSQLYDTPQNPMREPFNNTVTIPLGVLLLLQYLTQCKFDLNPKGFHKISFISKDFQSTAIFAQRSLPIVTPLLRMTIKANISGKLLENL